MKFYQILKKKAITISMEALDEVLSELEDELEVFEDDDKASILIWTIYSLLSFDDLHDFDEEHQDKEGHDREGEMI